jgi:MFS family permease
MFSGAWVIILGAIIASTSSKLAQLIIGRFVLGIGIQMMTVAAPAYAIEISPPHWRGRCVGKASDSLAVSFPCFHRIPSH